MPADARQTWESKSLTHPRQLLGCAVSPCGEYVVAGDFDGVVSRWRLGDDQRVALEGHSTWVEAVAFHPDRRRLFSTDYHGQICSWNYADESPRPLWTVQGAHDGWIRDAVATQNHLLTAGNDRVIRVWSADSGQLVRELRGHGGAIFTLALHPEGSLASGDQHGVIKHWDMATGRLVRDLNASALWHAPETTMSLTGMGGVRSLAFSRDGTTLYAGGITSARSVGFAEGNPLLLALDWAAGTARPNLRFPDPVFEGYVTSIMVHADFVVAAGGGVGGGLWFWRPGETDTFATLRNLRHLREVHLHPDGERLIAATFEPRGQGGNGRRGNMAEYVDNVGAIKVFTMTPRPTPPRR